MCPSDRRSADHEPTDLSAAGPGLFTGDISNTDASTAGNMASGGSAGRAGPGIREWSSGDVRGASFRRFGTATA
jgi:hypothetical protein